MGARNSKRAMASQSLDLKPSEAEWDEQAHTLQRLDKLHPLLQTPSARHGTCVLAAANLGRLFVGRLLWRGTANGWHDWIQALELRGEGLGLRRGRCNF